MIGPLAYIGGKRRLARRLIAMFPPHTTYVEPFAGGAQVFFAKAPSHVEVLNDVDGDIANLLRVMQSHHAELLRCLRYAVASRRMFALYERQDPTTLTDVHRAARFIYLQKNCFGGLAKGRTYHYFAANAPNYNPRRLPQVLEAAAKRLERVQLEEWPYERVLDRFDRPTTFFFCDPPYVGKALYRHNLEGRDFERLAEQLAGIRGKFLLTINDCDLARRVFARFRIEETALSYTCARTVPAVVELVITNYPQPN